MNVQPSFRHVACGAVVALGLFAGPHAPTFAQQAADRVWLAGRYDASRIIVYFDAVDFGATLPTDLANANIAPPIAEGFFSPMALPPDYVARFQRSPDPEHFALGDHYDLLLGGGDSTAITLTTLIGWKGDEFVGNTSYIGALATPERADSVSARTYYVVQRHPATKPEDPRPAPARSHSPAVLDRDPVAGDIRRQATAVMTSRLSADNFGRVPADVTPTIVVDRFTLDDGSPRYYVRAEWRWTTGDDLHTFAFAAWMTSSPQLRIVAVEPMTLAKGFDNELPHLLNVVGLGGGRTAIITSIHDDDTTELLLADNRDGLSVMGMPVIQAIGASE